LGFAHRVGRSVVTTRLWQTHVVILGCEYGAQAKFSIWRRIFISSYSLPLSGRLIGLSGGDKEVHHVWGQWARACVVRR
jgi:hypothetical protein